MQSSFAHLYRKTSCNFKSRAAFLASVTLFFIPFFPGSNNNVSHIIATAVFWCSWKEKKRKSLLLAIYFSLAYHQITFLVVWRSNGLSATLFQCSFISPQAVSCSPKTFYCNMINILQWLLVYLQMCFNRSHLHLHP